MAPSPAGIPRKITQRGGDYSGKGMLTAELLLGFVLVGIRVVEDYEPQSDGTAKGKVLHPAGQLGPLPILCGLVITFFILSFLTAAGGLKAKLAVIFGGILVLALAMNTLTEIKGATTTIGNIGKIAVPAASGQEGSGADNANASAAATGTNPPGVQGNQSTAQPPAAVKAATPAVGTLSGGQPQVPNPISQQGLANDVTNAARLELQSILPGSQKIILGGASIGINEFKRIFGFTGTGSGTIPPLPTGSVSPLTNK